MSVSIKRICVIRSRYLHVWRLQDQKLHHIVELPERVKSVKQLVAIEQIFDQHNNTVCRVWYFNLLNVQ